VTTLREGGGGGGDNVLDLLRPDRQWV